MSRNDLLKAYAKYQEELPASARRTCASVLFNCLQAVTDVSGGNGRKDGLAPAHEVICGASLVLLPQGGANATFTSLLAATRKASRFAADIGNDSILLPANDSNMLRSACAIITMMSEDPEKAHPYTKAAVGAVLSELHDFEYRALVRRHVPLVLRNDSGRTVVGDADNDARSVDGGSAHGDVGFPLLVDSSLSRSVNEAELRTFSKLKAADLYYFNQLQQADEMINSISEPLPSFIKPAGDSGASDISRSLILGRRYVRPLSGSTLAQIISSERLKEPMVLQKYYSATDELVLLLHWPPPHRRIKRGDWSPLDVNARLKALLPDAERFQQDSVVITPAGKAVVVVKQLYSTGAAWVTLHLDSDVFGLRQGDLVNYSKSKSMVPKRHVPDVHVKAEAVSSEGITDVSAAEETNAEAAQPGTEDAEEQDEGEEGEGESASIAAEADPAPTLKVNAEPVVDPSSVPRTSFVYEAEDGARLVVDVGPTPKKPKPDKFGTVILTHTDAAGLSTTAWSNGTFRFHSSVLGTLQALGDAAGDEASRVIAAQGAVTRNLVNGPYDKDVMFRDGSRILFAKARPSSAEEKKKTHSPKGFHARLLQDAPTGWTYVRLGTNGTVVFFTNRPGQREDKGIAHASLKDIRTVSVDAETKARVISFMDGRTIVSYTDDMLDVTYPDGTRFMTASDQVVYISKNNMPAVEIDLDIDSMCIGHAQGKQVSIAKGGLRVRSRVALDDGSALLVKYDTSITAECNGSLKLVRRDRTVVRALDTGEVTFSPKTAWDHAAEAEFRQECLDTFAAPVAAPSSPSAAAAAAASQVAMKRAQSNASLLVHGGADDRVNQSVTFQHENLSDASRGEQSISTVLGPSPEKAACPYDDPLQTRYVFHLQRQLCTIQDFEFNRFDINLSDPMNPVVDLAGEVEGLKPEAVTDKPLDPRMFIISRTADALEIVADDSVTDLQRLAWYNVDVEVVSGDTPPTGPKGLNPTEAATGHTKGKKASQQDGPPSSSAATAAAKFSSFYSRQRLGIYDDKYTFDEVFSKRSWRNRNTPAIASIDQRRSSSSSSKASASARPPLAANIYKIYNFHERLPLTAAEYTQLTRDIQSWKRFQNDRLASIDRFAVGDFRSAAEQKEEEDVQARLRLLYKGIAKDKRKAAKVQRQAPEQTHDSAEAAKAAAAAAAASPARQPQGEERVQTADADDDSSVVRARDALRRAADIAEREIRDAFEGFAVDKADGTQVLQYKDISSSLLQLFGQCVDGDSISLGLEELGIRPSNPHSSTAKPAYDNAALSFYDFRSLHGTIAMLLQVKAEEEDRKRQQAMKSSLPIPPGQGSKRSVLVTKGSKADRGSGEMKPQQQLQQQSGQGKGSDNADDSNSALLRVKTGPGRLQKSDDDVADQPQDERLLYEDGGELSASFIEGWSEVEGSAANVDGGLGQGSMERLSKTAPGKAQSNIPRSWYEDDADGHLDGDNSGLQRPLRGGGVRGVGGSMTEDISSSSKHSHSSQSVPQGSAIQVARAKK